MTVMVQTTLRTADGIPANFIVNQFCIDGMESGDNNDQEIVDAIKGFYDAINGPVLSDAMNVDGHICKFYSLPGVTPNYPYTEITWGFDVVPTGDTFAPEVALCLSFQAQRTPGFPQARRRGRIFIGQIRDGIQVGGRPDGPTLTSVRDAAIQLSADISGAAPGYRWAVWSVVDQEANFIVDGWIDDSWDTQRSRGYKPTVKLAWQAVF